MVEKAPDCAAGGPAAAGPALPIPSAADGRLSWSMDRHDLEQLAGQVLRGELSVKEFVARVYRPTVADLGEAQIDLDRHRRCGFPEVVFAEGKTVAAMEKIFQAQIAHGSDVLATRMAPEQAAELLAKFPQARYNPVGRTFRIPRGARRRAGADGSTSARRAGW